MRLLKYELMMVALTVFAATILIADTYEISWHTIDGGGASEPGASLGGVYALAGAIGQPDAGPSSGSMTGGSFEVVGGFWHASVLGCSCLGDMNADGGRNGDDIQAFVNCVLADGACACADLDGLNGVSLDDVPLFVSDLLSGDPCP